MLEIVGHAATPEVIIANSLRLYRVCGHTDNMPLSCPFSDAALADENVLNGRNGAILD